MHDYPSGSPGIVCNHLGAALLLLPTMTVVPTLSQGVKSWM